METWKTIPNFTNYQASTEGRIRSLNYKRTGLIKVLKPAKSKDGYMQTMLLSDDGKYKSWKVHKFVAVTFLGDKPTDKEINHKNGIKHDNSVDNLEYMTRSENCQHSFDTGLQKPKVGSLNGMAKLTEAQVAEIREIAKSRGKYYNRKELAERYGVSQYCIKDIVTRRRGSWYHV